MGPTWALSAPDGPHVGPMNLASRDGEITIPDTIKDIVTTWNDYKVHVSIKNIATGDKWYGMKVVLCCVVLQIEAILWPQSTCSSINFKIPLHLWYTVTLIYNGIAHNTKLPYSSKMLYFIFLKTYSYYLTKNRTYIKKDFFIIYISSSLYIDISTHTKKV